MAKNFLNDVAPLVKGHYENITKFSVKNGGLEISLDNAVKTTLIDSQKFVGYIGQSFDPKEIILERIDKIE